MKSEINSDILKLTHLYHLEFIKSAYHIFLILANIFYSNLLYRLDE